MYDSILVPLDASSFGEQALPYAEALARRTGADVTLVHVHEPLEIDGLMPDPRWDRRVMERERAYIEGVAETLHSRADGGVSTALLHGDPIAAISEYMNGHAADLVVMTTHGRTGFQRTWLGSVADGLVRRVDSPILLIRPTDEPPPEDPTFEHVLVPLAGGEGSERILDHAVDIGQPGGARYTLFRVLPPSVVVGGHVFYLDQARLDELTEQADDYLEGVAKRISDEARDVETVVMTNASPADAILDWAAEHDVDLIAMATRGQAGIRRWLLGSVADKVVRSAHVPLLLLRSPYEETERAGGEQ